VPFTLCSHIEPISRCQFHQNFTRAFFVRKSLLCLEFVFEQTLVRKMRAYNIDEIDGWGHVNQHFAFFNN